MNYYPAYFKVTSVKGLHSYEYPMHLSLVVSRHWFETDSFAYGNLTRDVSNNDISELRLNMFFPASYESAQGVVTEHFNPKQFKCEVFDDMVAFHLVEHHYAHAGLIGGQAHPPVGLLNDRIPQLNSLLEGYDKILEIYSAVPILSNHVGVGEAGDISNNASRLRIMYYSDNASFYANRNGLFTSRNGMGANVTVSYDTYL